ncbi:unnamed protein product [Linum trigynum]|uniref:Uncharacterized protein n=1 Tax=Linum trigynum TaxID=586398 RepID=A0AAV2CF69_9ROSI
MVESSVKARKTQIRVQEEQPAVVFKHRESDEQRDNLFHSRCFVEGKLISFVINGGCCSNIISLYAVQKLGLMTQRHPAPYQLSWINEHGTINVTKQAVVRFQLGSYDDEVICDVVSMNYVHLILGRPWQFDRGVTHNGWENSYTFRYKGRKIKLKPLSPDDVYTDQKQIEENQNEGKEPRAQLWIQRRIGFNFLSFRKLEREFPTPETTASNDLYFSDVKQSSSFGSPADVVEAKPAHDAALNASVDVDGGMREQGEVPKLKNDAKFSLVRRAEFPDSVFSSEKQSVLTALLAGATGDNSKSSLGAKTLNPIPIKSKGASLETISLETQESNCAKVPLFVKNTAEQNPLVGSAIQLKSSQTNGEEPSKDVRGTCGMHQFVSKMPGIKTPNFYLAFLGCENSNFGDGGNGELEELQTLVMNRCCRRDQNCYWRPGEDVVVDELDWRSCNRKPPNCSSKNMYKGGVRRPGACSYRIPEKLNKEGGLFRAQEECLVVELDCGSLKLKSPISPNGLKFVVTIRRTRSCSDQFQAKLVINRGLLQLQPTFPTTLLPSIPLKQIEGEYGTEMFASKMMFEKPSFDPIWDQFSERFEQRKAKVLRATLFQEGGPDMIPNCRQFTSQLLNKEAIKVGKKKGRIWLSQNPCSGYILCNLFRVDFYLICFLVHLGLY